MSLFVIVILVTRINIELCTITPKAVNYANYSLYITTPKEEHQLKFLKNLESEKYLDVMYWRRPVKLYYDVHMLIHNSDMSIFLERARHHNLGFKKTLDDVQEAFKNQTVRQYVRLRVNSFNWENYHSIEDIYQWLTDIASKYPNDCELISIGKSVEGRDIFAMVIKNGVKKNAIIEAGIHGNEWIAIEFALYLIDNIMVKNLFKQFNKVNWYIIPIVNPDGFSYSQTKDRLWRKNRRPTGSDFGIDLNRNFNYNFRAFSASVDPRDDEYCGPEPFSEPETQALRTFVKHHSKNLKFYFSLHAYGQSIILPYGDRVKHMDGYSEMENFGKQAIMKIFAMTNAKYTIGTYYDTMGIRISGNSASWVKKFFKVRYVMTFLLRDNGTYGHALPVSRILPACKDAITGLHTVMTAQARHVPSNLYGSNAVPEMLSVYTLAVLALVLNKL